MRGLKMLICVICVVVGVQLRIVSAEARFPYVLPPAPLSIPGQSATVMDLSGSWRLSVQPPKAFWRHDLDTSDWSRIQVPGEILLQGFDIRSKGHYAGPEQVCVYRTRFTIPEAWKDLRYRLRFHGAYNHARVWINGRFVREHRGGTTLWDCALEDLVAGEEVSLTVALRDDPLDPANTSRHARRTVMGLIRKVELLALPAVHLTRLHIETDLSADYRHAKLQLKTALSDVDVSRHRFRLRLYDPQGKLVRSIAEEVLAWSAEPGFQLHVVPVADVQTWDAEHPRLYRLELDVLHADQLLSTLTRHIGFRELQWNASPHRPGTWSQATELLVNGKAVKLRGMNRTHTHPLLGMALPPDLEERDVQLLVQANINYVRTAHCPPSEHFLHLCDKYGLYVECEAPVCFAKADDKNKEHKKWYVPQVAEMIECHRNHPSIIIWSLGNESKWSPAMQALVTYTHKHDSTRPSKFSWGTNKVHISSRHYPRLGQVTACLADEFALCGHFKHAESSLQMRTDPAYGDFYGESLDRHWRAMMKNDKSLGGAIWASPDQIVYAPFDKRGKLLAPMKADWGMFDGWRRPKPQYFQVYKAFAPVRLKQLALPVPEPDQALTVQVENRHDHTDINELQIRWFCGSAQGELRLDAEAGAGIAPRQQGALTFPKRQWRQGDRVVIEFRRRDGLVLNRQLLLLGRVIAPGLPAALPAPRLEKDGDTWRISGQKFVMIFDAGIGQFRHASYQETELLRVGPRLNMMPKSLPAWKLSRCSHSSSAHAVHITVSGSHGSTHVEYQIDIGGNGQIDVHYQIANPPDKPAAHKVSVVQECGIMWELPASMERLAWKRLAKWTCYPEGHIGRPAGTALRRRLGPARQRRQAPTWPWSQDECYFYRYGAGDTGGRGTADFRSSKYAFLRAACLPASGRVGLVVWSDGSDSARVESQAKGRMRLRLSSDWTFGPLHWGNWEKPLDIADGHRGSVRLLLSGDAQALVDAMPTLSQAHKRALHLSD